MVRTKGLQATVKNWKDAQGRVAANYSAGVQRTTDWQAKAIQGEQNYADGVQRAVQEKARAKGLSNVSDSDWQQAALNKGSQRIVAGMQASESKFSNGVQKNLATIEGVSLPPRTQDAATNVQNRVIPIAVALQKQKRG